MLVVFSLFSTGQKQTVSLDEILWHALTQKKSENVIFACSFFLDNNTSGLEYSVGLAELDKRKLWKLRVNTKYTIDDLSLFLDEFVLNDFDEFKNFNEELLFKLL